MHTHGMNYPLHLESPAGDGEDARIKSAIGIGTLLNDGIGDTSSLPHRRSYTQKFVAQASPKKP